MERKPRTIAVMEDKIILAYDRWCSIVGRNEFSSFWKFLHTPVREIQSPARGWHYIRVEGVNNLKMLLSPHYKVYVRIHIARKHNAT